MAFELVIVVVSVVAATLVALRFFSAFPSSSHWYTRINVSTIFDENCASQSSRRKRSGKHDRKVKVAIIGAGVGGTSAAYFINDLLRDRAEIHVYGDGKVGGRSAVVNFDGHSYEAGATIIHKDNMYMAGFAKKFGLTRIPRSYEGRIGIFDGFKFVFCTSSNGILTALRMLWRYGLSLLKLNKLVNSNFDKFVNIYHLQKQGRAFKTVPEMLTAMGHDFLHMTQISAQEYFAGELGLNKRTVDELVTSAVTVIYDQTCNANAFVAMASLAGVQRDSLWSVLGGNFQVAQDCLKESGAQFHATRVTCIKKQINDSGSVMYILTDSSTSETSVYDAVILAAPLCNCGITFEGFDCPIYTKASMQPYHQTVATFVKGQINPRFFGESSLDENFPLNILTTEMVNPDAKTSSHGIALPVDVEEKQLSVFRQCLSKDPTRIWKVFSSEPLLKEDISKLFTSHEKVQENVWTAYPQFSPPEDFSPFVLDNSKLFYINCIEKVASAMEMSMIGAKNCALLLDSVVEFE